MIAARLPVPLLLALMSASAHAQVASDPVGASAQGDIAVTIYNGGQSLVQDERRRAATASNFPMYRRASGPRR